MFPVTITLHDATQLNAVIAALAGGTPAPKPAPAEKAASGKPTAKADAAPTKTVAAETPAAQSAETKPQASTAATTEGNVPAATTEVASTTASTASSSEASASQPVSFDVLKKAFLALSTKEGGRAKCEGVLKPLGLGKLSEAKEDQYAALLDAINQASAA